MTYRFWPTFWRRASCGLCGALVARRFIQRHALWHADLGHHAHVGPVPHMSAVCDVTVLAGRATSSGWITAGTGPR